MEKWWPLQARLIELHLDALAKGGAAGSHDLAGKAKRCLSEILCRAQLGICPDCKGQGSVSLPHPAAQTREFQTGCGRCEGTGMISHQPIP